MRILVVLIILSLNQGHHLNAQIPGISEDLKDSLLKLVDYTHHVVLEPARENLKLISADDPALQKWLDLLKLEKSFGNFGNDNIGKAYATWGDGYPIVHIDLAFIEECFKKADLAGVFMSNPSDYTTHQIGFEYGKKLSLSIVNSTPIPSLEPDLNSIGLDDAQIVLIKHMSNFAFISAVQFVMLHEIGHHQKNHLDREPYTLLESQQWELEADRWAFNKMKSIGFGFDPLYNMLLAFASEEEMKRLAGIKNDVVLSTHPSWLERLAILDEFDRKKPSTIGNWTGILTVSSHPISGKFYCNTLMIPRKPIPGLLVCQFDQFDIMGQMPLEFEDNGDVNIYGRTPSELSKIIVSELDSNFPKIQFVFTDLGTGQTSTSETTGYQFNLADLSSNSLKDLPMSVRDFMFMDSNQIFIKGLKQVESNNVIINRAIQIQNTLMLKINESLLNYAKGKIDVQTGEKQVAKDTRIAQNQLIQLFGNAKYQILQQKLLNSPIAIAAINKLQN